MICDFCRHWTPITWQQYHTRLANMHAMPEAEIYPCPRCGSRDWATTPPPGEPPVSPLDKVLNPSWSTYAMMCVVTALVSGMIVGLAVIGLRGF